MPLTDKQLDGVFLFKMILERGICEFKSQKKLNLWFKETDLYMARNKFNGPILSPFRAVRMCTLIVLTCA